MRISTSLYPRSRPRSNRSRLSLCAFFLAVACDGSGGDPDAGYVPARTVPRFDLAADPMDFGAIPFPDDLYLDDAGHPALGELPSEALALAPEFPAATRAMLAELDGFSASAPVFFSLPPRSLDPATLPASPASSTREDASVALFDADSGSPTAFRRVPVSVRWDAERGLLALRPSDGHPLKPGGRYAAVLTTSVLDDAGLPIGPHPRFRAIRDAGPRPADPLDAEAHDQYADVLTSLSGNGVAPDEVAALAVFTVQSVAPELAAARATAWAGEAPRAELVGTYASGAPLDGLLGTPVSDLPGLDVEGGVTHRRIGHLVHGRFESPWLLGDQPGVHGRFRADGSGGLTVGRREQVPFTLVVPSSGLDNLRVVVFQHGLGGERSSMLAIADALAGAGYATLAIDIPYHGMRATAAVADATHNYGVGEGPDDFGDRVGQEIQLDYFGVIEERGELPAFHPVYVRDVVRQSVVDLMTLVRLVREGDWSAVQAEPGLEGLAFAPEPLGFVGVSLGGIIGTIFTAHEPEIGAAVLNVTGGDWARLVEHSGSFSGVFLPLLLPRIGVDPSSLEPADRAAAFLPEIALVSTLLDRGDAIASAPILAAGPTHVLFQMALDDETVGNLSTEALARAANASIVDADPVHADLPRVSGPVMENVEIAGGRVTRGLTVFAPATHGLLSDREASQRFAHPPLPPFEPVSPSAVANPVDAAVAQVVYFFESWRAGGPQIQPPAP